MPYKKSSNGEYKISNSLRAWLRELEEIFELVTKTKIDPSDPRIEGFLNIAALSMGTQAKIKWEKWWFFKNKAKKIEALLTQLQENQISCMEVIDYLADQMLIVEMRQMRTRIISDVTAYLQAERELADSNPQPISPDNSSIKLTHVERYYTYPLSRFPKRWLLDYNNSVFVQYGMTPDSSISIQFLPGVLSATKFESSQAFSSIFLSHNHADKDFARKLARDLQVSKVKVWINEAEIKVGDSLLSKIQTGIQEMEYLGAILSPNSVNSEWVTRELQAAMQLEINRRRVKVLPILYQPCDLPLFLLDKMYVDFSNPAKYKISLDTLVNTLLDFPPCVLLTAKEAARLVKTVCNPVGSLCGISQQGICHQCIPEQIRIRGDWYYADAKTGRSTIWFFEYYDSSNKGFSTYGVIDGKLSTSPLGCLIMM